MADIYFKDLTTIDAVEDADLVPIHDVSGAVDRKATRTQLLATAAKLAAANTFTASQGISGPNVRFDVTPTTGQGKLVVGPADNGASFGGQLWLGNNNNASTPSSGFAYITNKNNATFAIWPDGAGNLRIFQGVPTNAADLSGVVVGAQTSSLDKKDVLEGMSTIDEVLAAVKQGSEAVRKFRYKPAGGGVDEATGKRAKGDRPFNGETFEGLVTDFAPRYGMDEDEAHPAGKSLNMVNAIGDLLRAVAWLVEREQARGA